MSSRRHLKKTSCTADQMVRSALGAMALLASGIALGGEVILPEQVPYGLRPLVERLHNEGRRNLVLNLDEVGVAAFEEGDIPLSERAFDAGLAEIETVYASNENAAKARSLWYEEGAKDFKGEPYERSMAFYYRGLLDISKGDYENAQAAFETGLQQDAFAEEEQYSSDFALLAFLKGWSYQQMGDLSKSTEYYDEVARLRPGFRPPAPGHNALIIVESGRSPRKLSDGVGHYELVYRRGKRFREQTVSVEDAQPVLTESIYWQASTRGGRPVDSIIAGKVAFKDSTRETGAALAQTGEVGLMVGSLRGGQSGLQNAGLALGLVGVVSMAVSARARTKADTRYWSNLPDKVHVLTTHVAQAVVEKRSVRFFDAQGNEVVGLPSSVTLRPVRADSSFGWVRSRSALDIKKGQR